MTVAPREQLIGSMNRSDNSFDKVDNSKSNEIRRIVFSKNEKFMVLIMDRYAQIVKIHPNKMELLNSINLDELYDFGNKSAPRGPETASDLTVPSEFNATPRLDKEDGATGSKVKRRDK